MTHGHGGFGSVVAPRSKFYQGPFGRICGDLEPWSPEVGKDPAKPTEMEIRDHFLDIANKDMVEIPGKTPTQIDENSPEVAALTSNIPAGYTYFGQFIDHDITFDPASSLMRQNDPAGLLNHRTPRLDLDNVYGRGPDDSPYLYDRKKGQGEMLIGKIADTEFPDLPRNSQGRALIGDMRNDENAIVSQLQLAFLKAHNTLVDRALGGAGNNKTVSPFAAARKTLRWLYQYIVWNDFIPRIAIDDVRNAALAKKKTPDGRTTWELGLKDVYNWRNHPFMPVEFSVAAYRFGHSMVRNAYQTNQPARGFGNFVPIFDNIGTSQDPDDLRGFRPMKLQNAIQWDWFLQMTTSGGPFPQKGRKIDTSLSNALTALHEEPAGSPMNVLAFRNLLRGWRFGLPSGTAVAKKFCVDPIEIEPGHDALWFYILKEAEGMRGSNAGNMLGRVGSIIVCAVFAGLLKGDPNSYFNVEPCWTPNEDPLLRPEDRQDSNDWTLASIIRLAGLPVDARDFESVTKTGNVEPDGEQFVNV